MKIPADVVRFGQKGSAGCAAIHVHLLFDDHAEILYKMNSVCNLSSLRCALAGSLRVEATTIPADDLDFRMAAQPLRATLHVAGFQNVDNRAPFEIDDDCPVVLRFSPAPVVNANDVCRWSIVSGRARQLAKDRVVVDLDA